MLMKNFCCTVIACVFVSSTFAVPLPGEENSKGKYSIPNLTLSAKTSAPMTLPLVGFESENVILKAWLDLGAFGESKQWK